MTFVEVFLFLNTFIVFVLFFRPLSLWMTSQDALQPQWWVFTLSEEMWFGSQRMWGLLLKAFMFWSTLFPSQFLLHKHSTQHSMMLPPPCFTVGMVVPGFLQTGFLQAKECNLCFIRPENFTSHGLRVFQVPFAKLQAGCHVAFTEEWVPPGHSTIHDKRCEYLCICFIFVFYFK